MIYSLWFIKQPSLLDNPTSKWIGTGGLQIQEWPLELWIHKLHDSFFVPCMSVTQVLPHLLCTNSPSLCHYQSHFLSYLPALSLDPHTCIYRCVRPNSVACEMQSSWAKRDRRMQAFPGERRWHTRNCTHGTSAQRPVSPTPLTYTGSDVAKSRVSCWQCCRVWAEERL